MGVETYIPEGWASWGSTKKPWQNKSTLKVTVTWGKKRMQAPMTEQKVKKKGAKKNNKESRSKVRFTIESLSGTEIGAPKKRGTKGVGQRGASPVSLPWKWD